MLALSEQHSGAVRLVPAARPHSVSVNDDDANSDSFDIKLENVYIKLLQHQAQDKSSISTCNSQVLTVKNSSYCTYA